MSDPARRKITILETQLLSLWFYPQAGILHHQLHTFIPAAAFEELLTAGLDYIERQKATKWLSDNRGNPIVTQETAEWARTVWAPRAIGAGFKYWAAVMPSELLGRMQMRTFIDEYAKLGVTVHPFEDVDKALRWLETVDRPAVP